MSHQIVSNVHQEFLEFARIGVEPFLDVSFDTCIILYIAFFWDCLYIRNVESRDSEEGDVA